MNAIICKHCGDVLVSRYNHDFKMCKCGRVGVDGGKQKQCMRRIGEFGDWIEVDDVMDMLESLKTILLTICNKEDADATSMENSRR